MPDQPNVPSQSNLFSDSPRPKGRGGDPIVIPVIERSSAGPRRRPLGTNMGHECDGCFSSVLDQFAKSFDKSAKRWELIVYPSLFAFIVLAMYGFFLIYSLTQDIRTMAVSIDPKMGVNMGSLSNSIQHLADNVEMMSTHLEYISDNMETMAMDMRTISESMENMNSNVEHVNKSMTQVTKVMEEMSIKLNTLSNLTPMTASVASLAQSVNYMTTSVSRMGHDMNSATRPMSFINRFMPW